MYHPEKVDEFIVRSETLANAVDKDTAFDILVAEIDKCEDKYLNDYLTALNIIRNERSLEWIEQNIHRSTNITSNWGHLAASSYFTWERAERWLKMGRPLSLVALDAIYFCTTVGERLNQSPWMRKIQPKLIDQPSIEVVAKRLHEYLKSDSVPRTKTTVEVITQNIFDARQYSPDR